MREASEVWKRLDPKAVIRSYIVCLYRNTDYFASTIAPERRSLDTEDGRIQTFLENSVYAGIVALVFFANFKASQAANFYFTRMNRGRPSGRFGYPTEWIEMDFAN